METRPSKYTFTPLAMQDIDDIMAYITIDLFSPQAAERLLDRIEEELESVCDFPFSRPVVANAILQAKGYRIIVVENFNLFYKIEDDTIVVYRVLYGRRNYTELLGIH